MKAKLLTKVKPTDKVGDEVPDELAAQYVRAGLAEYPAEDDELTALRAEYKAKMGKQAYHGWDEATIREKMGE